MIVRDKVRTEPPHEGARYTQIAVLEDGVVVEHFVTSAAQTSLVGNIYLGIVQNVLPSMEAAFVDIGRGRNGVLYAGEVNWEAAGLGGAPQDRAGPQTRRLRRRPGQQGSGRAQGRPADHPGVAGRPLSGLRAGSFVDGHQPQAARHRAQRLKEILREVVPADAGVIISTASEGVKEEDIRSDVERLAEALDADRGQGRRNHREEGRRRDRALRRARCARQGHPRPVQ